MDYKNCKLHWKDRVYNLPDHFSTRTLGSFVYDLFKPDDGKEQFGYVTDEDGWLCNIEATAGPLGSGRVMVKMVFKLSERIVVVNGTEMHMQWN